MHWAFTFISFYTISIVPIAAFPIILERGPIYLKKGIVLYFQNNQAPEQFLASNYTQDVKAISVYLSDPKTDPSARLRFITIADTDLSIGKTSIALVQPQSDDPEKFVDSLNVNRYNGRLDVYPTPLSGQVQADSWYIHGPGSMGSDAAPFGFACE